MTAERQSAESVERIAKVTRPRSVREALAAELRPLRVLPDAWFEPHVPEAMSDWITRNQALT